MRPISLAHLTVIGLAPPQMIRLAARIGYDAVGLRLLRVTETSPGYPLHLDPAMLRETEAALRESGITVQDIEFLRLSPTFQAKEHLAMLEAGARLGAGHVICAPYDPDLGRMADNLARLAEAAAEFGVAPVLEFFPWTVLPDLASARALIDRAGHSALGILVDALHFNRSGSRIADLDALPASRLPFLHLCDAPVSPPYSEEQLLHAGRVERLPPGEGQIDLMTLLGHFPQGAPVSLEVPMERLSRAQGYGATAQRVYQAAQALLSAESRERQES